MIYIDWHPTDFTSSILFLPYTFESSRETSFSVLELTLVEVFNIKERISINPYLVMSDDWRVVNSHQFFVISAENPIPRALAMPVFG